MERVSSTDTKATHSYLEKAIKEREAIKVPQTSAWSQKNQWQSAKVTLNILMFQLLNLLQVENDRSTNLKGLPTGN